MDKEFLKELQNFSISFAKDAAFDDENKTISFVALSKDNLHKRTSFWGDEYYLSVDTSNVKFNAKTLYKDHNPTFENAIGKIVDTKFENGTIKAKVQFNDEVRESKEAYAKYKAGFSNSVSVGFGEYKVKEMDKIDGIDHYQIYEGEIIELSAVWQGTDKNAVVSKFNKSIKEGGQMPEAIKKLQEEAAPDTQKLQAEQEVQTFNKAQQTQSEERANIIELAKIMGREKEGLDAISEGKTYAQFSKEMAALNSQSEVKKVNIITNKTDDANFSLAKIIRSAVDRNIDLSREMQNSGKEIGRFALPDEFVAQFNDTITKTSNTGDIVNQSYRSDLLVDQLKQESKLLGLCTWLTGLHAAVTIPRDTSNITADFVEEGGTRDAEKLAFDNIKLAPHTLNANIVITRTMLNMAAIDLESFAFKKLKEAIRKKLELTMLYGGSVVKGLFDTSGIPTVQNYMKAPTLDLTLKFGDLLDASGANTDHAKFFLNGTDISKLRATKRGESLDRMLIDVGDTDLQGYQYFKNNNLKSGDVIFGNFEDIYVGAFGSLEVLPLMQRGGDVLLQAFYDIDIKFAREKSFAVSKTSE
ncbi:phage capsid protein [Campylobacter pinnipediorum subsp. pinnipediorum]|uniref:Phage capsid protein n=1 Tax=Campylobacter pinnipediorum subsp. pinnipediorum TaxID=1660067 RepID=A0AAX0L9V2_9BACT|nr:phage major capsid protein [Campylobacter pinnipediorum]OPA77258.1 phage capsid protein [Campylobacter pinnipediorum subsp. pinnipediorum]